MVNLYSSPRLPWARRDTANCCCRNTHTWTTAFLLSSPACCPVQSPSLQIVDSTDPKVLQIKIPSLPYLCFPLCDSVSASLHKLHVCCGNSFSLWGTSSFWAGSQVPPVVWKQTLPVCLSVVVAADWVQLPAPNDRRLSGFYLVLSFMSDSPINTLFPFIWASMDSITNMHYTCMYLFYVNFKNINVKHTACP